MFSDFQFRFWFFCSTDDITYLYQFDLDSWIIKSVIHPSSEPKIVILITQMESQVQSLWRSWVF